MALTLYRILRKILEYAVERVRIVIRFDFCHVLPISINMSTAKPNFLKKKLGGNLVAILSFRNKFSFACPAVNGVVILYNHIKLKSNKAKQFNFMILWPNKNFI